MKREVVKRETKETEFGDESIYAVLFTAGTALLIVGLQRAVMMFFIEQWRFWVFLVLNLVLLAIFFTSMHNPDDQNQEGEAAAADDDDSKRQKIKNGSTENGKNKEHCGYFSCDDEPVEAKCISGKNKKLQRESRNENVQESVKDEEEEEDDELELDPPRLSKQELNERVEAFIATFREHLVLDARKGRELNYSNSFPGSRKKGPESFIRLQKKRSVSKA